MDSLTVTHKLNTVLYQLGFIYMNGSSIVRYDPNAKTAYWYYNRKNNIERINIGPQIMGLDVGSIEMILRHEFLHKSTFNGFNEQYMDKQLSNITLDICINRLLFEIYPEKMRIMSSSVYGSEAKSTIIALADCTANGPKLQPELYELWNHIWRSDYYGNFNDINPASLYYRLYSIKNQNHNLFNYDVPFFIEYEQEESELESGFNNRQSRRLIEETLNRYPVPGTLFESIYGLSRVSGGRQTEEIRTFLKEIETRIIASNTGDHGFFDKSGYRVDPYPVFPTMKGIVYQALGLPDLLFTYQNVDYKESSLRKALGIYIDISSSMENYFPYIVKLVNYIKGIPVLIKGFTSTVKEIDIDEIEKGRLKAGGFTDFNPPIIDLLNNNEIEAGVIFTDGYAGVEKDTGEMLVYSRKALYAIYVRDQEADDIESELNKYVSKSLTITIKETQNHGR